MYSERYGKTYSDGAATWRTIWPACVAPGFPSLMMAEEIGDWCGGQGRGFT